MRLINVLNVSLNGLLQKRHHQTTPYNIHSTIHGNNVLSADGLLIQGIVLLFNGNIIDDKLFTLRVTGTACINKFQKYLLI